MVYTNGLGLVMTANTKSFDKTLFWEKRVFPWSIIDVDVFVYSHQLTVLWARKELQGKVTLGFYC